MADLTITPASVHIHDESARLQTVQFGEAMTAGKSTYLKASDNKYWLADADASAAEAAAKGVVIVGAGIDGYGVICLDGPIDVGAALTVGVAYIVSATAGGIAPSTDFSGYTGANLTHLGYATAADKLVLKPYVTGASN